MVIHVHDSLICLLLWFGLWFVCARHSRAIWVFMFAGILNSHSRVEVRIWLRQHGYL